MPIVSDIMEEARGTYLNDPSGNKYTNAILLPHVKTAYGYLQTALQANGIKVTDKSDTKVITAGTTEWTPLPSDLVVPIRCEERLSGSTDEYEPMYMKHHIKVVATGSRLVEWSWVGDKLLFREATADRQVRLYYRNSFPVLGAVADHVFGKAEQYLAAKSAALALLFVDQSETLAKVANDIAEQELAEVINLGVKQKQTLPVRRKPYMPFRTR